MEKNVFGSDIIVPDVVMQHADIALSQVRKESVKNMGNTINEETNYAEKSNRAMLRVGRKLVTAVAACAVLATTIGVGKLYVKNDSLEESVVMEEENMIVHENPFVLKVQAAGNDGGESEKLEPGTPVAINAYSNSWALSGQEDGMVSYVINLPLFCEGENIENITYSINKGYFQVVEKEDAGIITEGKELKGISYCGQIGGEYGEEDGLPKYPISLKYYSDITLAYEKQRTETTWINICDKVKISDMDLIWGMDNTIDDLKKGYQELIEGTIITCTIQFEDGKSQLVEIEVGTDIVPIEEKDFVDDANQPKEEVIFTLTRK